MKNVYCFAIIALFLSSYATAQDWKLVWSDEFDYTGAPDNRYWSFDTAGNAWDWGNNELQNYTPASMKNAWVENGNCIIEARKEIWDAGDNHRHIFTSARLRTVNKGDWLYGRFEIRAKLPAGKGTWPALWMLSTDNAFGEWPKSGEMDIMEHVGFDTNRIHHTIHTEAYNHIKQTQKTSNELVNDPINNYHIYALEWYPDRIECFVDQEKVFSFKNEGTGYTVWPFDKRFHLLMNIAVGGSWGGLKGIDTSAFPVRMYIDYVRVYSKTTKIIELDQNHPVKNNLKIIQNTNEDIFALHTDNASSGSICMYDFLGKLIASANFNFQSQGFYPLSLNQKSTKLSVVPYLAIITTSKGQFVQRVFKK